MQTFSHFCLSISETPPSERPQLFVKKLHQCRVLFDFNDASAELKGKQIKAQTLHEMLEYITTQRGVITENIYPEVVNMVGSLWGLIESPNNGRSSVCYQPLSFHTPSC
jgi:serine/threonine-protein phosphatase 2A regulatory subunit B'